MCSNSNQLTMHDAGTTNNRWSFCVCASMRAMQPHPFLPEDKYSLPWPGKTPNYNTNCLKDGPAHSRGLNAASNLWPTLLEGVWLSFTPGKFDFSGRTLDTKPGA